MRNKMAIALVLGVTVLIGVIVADAIIKPWSSYRNECGGNIEVRWDGQSLVQMLMDVVGGQPQSTTVSVYDVELFGMINSVIDGRPVDASCDPEDNTITVTVDYDVSFEALVVHFPQGFPEEQGDEIRVEASSAHLANTLDPIHPSVVILQQ